MGWTGHKLDNGWTLYTRGGLSGVFISNDKDGGERIDITVPEELLFSLAASHVRDKRISQLENATDKEILGIAD